MLVNRPQIQCLSNVKNIAMAVQIYLTDYDRLWPKEHRPEVIYGAPKDHPGLTSNCALEASTEMNPYLKPPVVLDEYIKNRDVWNCPHRAALAPSVSSTRWGWTGGSVSI